MRKEVILLLVEDNPMDVELTLDAFREVHFNNRIEVVRDGKEALDYLFRKGRFTEQGRYPMPDLVLLDLKLPGIDGFEVLRRIKGTPILKRLPVVILTSSAEEGDRAMTYDIGANSYIVKPVDFLGFIKVVKELTDYWFILNVQPPQELE